ncbi:acylphosphatase [Pseudooceanicola sp. CBS1P-1]|uniref:Acylphosphatase n=1 Tax=Pseudooceanicola albus TaxID=2692189 RepID=A0A6L7GAJ8_9RHOB|nr:acylphosphatase [Pseudooceanicola endophyticus]MXN20617.1 acylphosphatase [Pseudooceanicola albus]
MRGRVGAASFPPWIRRHGARLGLECRDLAQQEARVSLLLTGPPALLDAMEMGCSLGPWDIWVEQIDRFPLFPDAPDGAADD